MKQQTKSKKRISDFGEVFTAEREVNAMLDLVKQETERIESRFLEPACGDGNFLAEVLRRKLSVVRKRYGKNPDDFEMLLVSNAQTLLIRRPNLSFTKDPVGVGDMTSSLFLGHFLQGRSLKTSLELTTSAIFGVLKTTQAFNQYELAIIAAQAEFENPSHYFTAIPLN
jgi:pyridoxal kinase